MILAFGAVLVSESRTCKAGRPEVETQELLVAARH